MNGFDGQQSTNCFAHGGAIAALHVKTCFYDMTGQREIPEISYIGSSKLEGDEYFDLETLKIIVKQPLALTNTENKFDVLVNVYGGGSTGQAGAIRHGIARAMVMFNAEFKPEIKKAGFLTRDPRMKERKKYGLKKARKAPQFSKR